MPQLIPAVIQTVLATVGYTAAAAVGASVAYTTALAVGAAVIAGTAVLANKAMAMFEIDMPKVDTDASRQRTVKSTTEPYKIIYGETLVSGPISYIGMSGTDNEDLYHVIALAGHEVTDITDIYFDNELIQDSQINGGSSAGGNVTAGTFGPKNSTTICVINKHLGTATQAADSMMAGTFADYTSAHQGKGIAYIAMKWKLNEDSAEVWDKYAPSDIKAIVKGKAVYDPRLDTGGYGDDPTNDLFITYNATAGSYVGQGQNPALVLVDYLINDDFGMGIAPSKIDWNAVVTAADGCDVSVDVPGGTQKRFTCNGVLFGTDSNRANINKILSSMNGSLVYSNGKYIIRAGIYEAPTESLNEDDLIGAIGIKTSFERSDRFNTIKGIFIDPAQNYKSSEFPKVQLADAVTRDNGEVLEKEVQYPMTNSSYMAQRLSNKLIQLSDQQKVVSFPANLSALRITVGDRVQVSVEELSWSNKVFLCVGWTFSEEGGVNLTLREDSSTSYADPLPVAYSTITATGDITDGFRGVPSPSGLSATPGLKSNELNWVNPGRPADYGTIYVYASRNGNFSSAVKIGETDGTQFIHDASNKSLIFSPSVVNVGDTYTIRTVGDTNFVAMGAASNTVGVVFTATSTGSGTGSLWETLAPGNLRYYWVRAVKNVGTDAASQSNLEPNADPNTTVFATVGRVEWADVSGSTNAPADNATVGAQISVNLYDTDGSTVMNQADVKNSVLAQEILQVEIEAGEVLDLETGQNVDIQNLGDVAIYVSNQDAVLQSNINTVANSLSNLEDVIVDITSGTSDIYIQTTAPVPGVGGIPDPIPEFSRWYDSDDNNKPYYWNGTAWIDLSNPQIAQNASDISNLQTSLSTTNSNVSSNASAISVLDATTISQGNSITSIAADVTALETTVDDPTTGVAATSTALGNLTTRVTAAEGSITTNASDITTLQTDVTAAEGDITTNATAISGLDTRVTTAEGTITTQSSDITALQSTVNNATTGVVANANGLSSLTTRVDVTENSIDTNSSAITTLDATYTEDLHFRTEVEDESDDLINLETSGTVQLQDLTDFVAGSSSAIDALTVQTFANENGIQTQAIQITALESTVNDPTNGVVATAGALSSLSTEVSVIDGVVTSTAQDLSSLSTTVGQNTASITTQANSINGVEANYSVKIDNNNRITGFGLLSTTAGATPFSEFAVVADQFSIVSPDSTADTPIQPFTVTADKIYFGADVIVSGDLISTGTISADRLQIDGVMFDTETVGGVTSLIIKASGVNTSQIAESAITTARLSNDAVTVDKFANTLESTNYSAGSAGWRLTTDGDFEAGAGTFRGAITATSGAFDGAVSVGTTGAFYGGTSNAFNTGKGFFLGYDTGAYKLSIGDSSTGKSLTWDGDKLNVAANAVSFTTGGAPTYNSNSKLPVTVRSSVLDLTSNTDYVFFDNQFDQNLTLYASLYAGPLTSGVIAGEVNAKNAIMSQLSLQVQYAENVGGSPGTWQDFNGALLSGKKFITDGSSSIQSNYYVKVTDMGSGNYRADLATPSQVAADFTNIGYSEFGYGITDEDYYMTEIVTVYGFPKGEYFFRIVATVTDGSYTPYPSTGSPSLTNPRRLSINNALTYTDANHGLSAVAKGNPQTYFTRSNNSTLIDGGNLTIAVPEENSISNQYGGIFIAGRGETTDPSSIQPLGGIWFYNGVDDLGSGAGSIGSPNHSLFVPKTGDSLNINAAGNGIKFNGGYGSTGATIDTNGNINTDGSVLLTGDVILSASSGVKSVTWRDSDDSNETFSIEAQTNYDTQVDSLFNIKYNNGTTTPLTLVSNGNLLINGSFYALNGSINSSTASIGGGYGNTGATIDANGNYFADGNITISGTLSQGSDVRLKSDVKTIDGSKVFDMRGVTFIKNGEKGAGVIAQELQEIAPELVREGSDGILSVAYGDLVGYLIESVKTLKDEIEQIKADQS
jgi:predicted  nucleic acid-binding Zn-ribbon protein